MASSLKIKEWISKFEIDRHESEGWFVRGTGRITEKTYYLYPDGTWHLSICPGGYFSSRDDAQRVLNSSPEIMDIATAQEEQDRVERATSFP